VAAIDNPELFLRAFVQTARSLFANPLPWLAELRNQALVGNTLAVGEALTNLQDWGAQGISSQGASTQWLRNLSSSDIATYAQAAIDQITAETAGVPGGSTAVAGFNHRMSELG
jgi:hypothetical protein